VAAIVEKVGGRVSFTAKNHCIHGDRVYPHIFPDSFTHHKDTNNPEIKIHFFCVIPVLVVSN
jgi:hypothetical protein